MRQPSSLALKKYLIRTAPPQVRRQLLAWLEASQDLASRWKQAFAVAGPLPNFIVIGAQKCGTTYLYDELVQHPHVAAARTKEIHYFDINHDRGPGWYRAFFPRQAGARRQTGEASPGYLFHPHASRRLQALVPAAKLIVLLRNPIERAYSHYHHEVRLGYETLSFPEAIQQEASRLSGEMVKLRANEHYQSAALRHHSYLARGVYVDQLAEWREYFPPEQMLILQSEAFQCDPVGTLGEVVDFLGLPAWQPAQRPAKVFPYPKLDPDLRKRLASYFAPHNERLYAYLGVNYGWEH